MTMICADTATRIRATTQTDPYGNPGSVRDWAHATRTPLLGLSVQPDASATGSASTEDVGDRTSVVTGWRLFSSPGTDLDLLSTDRVELSDGTVTEVDGEIGRWTFAGNVHHVEVRLTRVRG